MTTVRNRVALLATLLALGCSSHPAAFGVVDRKLAPCPSAPHCVLTQAAKPAVAPAPYQSSRDDARMRLVEIIRSMPRARIVTEASDYIHAEFTSRRFHYVDDVEIFIDDRAKLVHFRSSARTGYYDFGANRRRVREIRQKFVEKS